MTRELQFVGTWEDSWSALDTILARGDVTLIPDLWYDEPTPLAFRAIDDTLKELLRQRRRVFLWSPEFSRHPPAFERLEFGPTAGKYQLRLSRGGPGLELSLPASFEARGVVHLNFGRLGYATATFDPETGGFEAPSRELRAGYADVRSRLCQRLLWRRRGVWMGWDAARLLKAGQATILSRQRPGRVRSSPAPAP